MPETVLRFSGTVDQASVGRLMSAVDQAIADDADRLRLLIASGGGSVAWGVAAYHWLLGAPLHVTTHNIGITNSVAVAMFCAGDERLASPHASFLLHPVRSRFQAGTLEEGPLEERLESLRADQAKIAGIIGQATGNGRDDILERMHARATLDADAAKAYGLIHDIRTETVPAGTSVQEIGSDPRPS